MPQGKSGRTARNFHLAYKKYGRLCVYCGNAANSIDHLLPHSYRADNSLENLAPACMTCNQLVGNKVFYTFEEKKSFILEERERKHLNSSPPDIDWSEEAEDEIYREEGELLVQDAIWEPVDDHEQEQRKSSGIDEDWLDILQPWRCHHLKAGGQRCKLDATPIGSDSCMIHEYGAYSRKHYPGDMCEVKLGFPETKCVYSEDGIHDLELDVDDEYVCLECGKRFLEGGAAVPPAG